MFAEPFDTDDGFRVWLDAGEVDTLLAAARGRKERIAFALGARSGLRVSEIVDIEAFLEHYRGSYSSAVQRRELSKVDWLDIGERGVGERDPELSILGRRGDG